MLNEPVRFTLFIPKDLKDRLADLAAKRQVSASLLGRRAIERFLRQEEEASKADAGKSRVHEDEA